MIQQKHIDDGPLKYISQMLRRSLALGGTRRRVTLMNKMLSNTSGYMFAVAEGREEGSLETNPGGVWMATWEQVCHSEATFKDAHSQPNMTTCR